MLHAAQVNCVLGVKCQSQYERNILFDVNQTGRSLLVHAAARGNNEVVGFLIRNGLDVNW